MKLDKFGNVNGMEVFALSRESRALVSGILLSAVKVERVDKQTGGLYDKLYLCLNYLLTECIKSCSGKSSAPTGLYRQYRSLLAAEVVLLMCYVPSFSEYMHKEPGVMSLVTCATNDAQIISNVLTLKESLQRQEAGALEQIQALGQFIQSAVMFSLSRTPGNVSGLKGQSAEQKIFSKRPLPKRPMSGPVFSSTYHTRGKTSPNVKPPRVISAKPKPAKQPDVGETVLTSPQCLARVVSLPQPDIALVLLEMIPVNGGMKSKPQSFEEHYAYIDTKELEWDAARFYWKPKGTAGNRVTLHYVEDASLLTRPLSQLDDTSIHHHSSGGVTSITVPMPVNTTERTSLMLDLDTHQDPLTVSPAKPGSVPAPSPSTHHLGYSHQPDQLLPPLT
ncbi:hypothetical protein EB796_023675 [Bugula neritina]|uniref:Uncharacterized protein n=1 Tax=Bugula neritina TaxID=10212 RepID=A0A7J7IX62_BUGNE|nr:hypothetical protein EB796_023675 [Bugula neritina]